MASKRNHLRYSFSLPFSLYWYTGDRQATSKTFTAAAGKNKGGDLISGKRFEAGVDIGATKTALALFDADTMLAQARYRTDVTLNAQETIAMLAQQLAQLAAQHGGHLSAIGIGAPSDIDYAHCYIRNTTNIPGLAACDLRQALQAYFGPIPIAADNDANTAALAEYRYGAGRGTEDMIYSTISTGIGGGLILNGKVYHGSHDYAGEIGHMIATPGIGVRCGRGHQGCFESYCGGANLYKHVQLRLAAGEQTMMTQWSAAENIDGKTWLRAWQAGDAMAQALLEQTGNYLGLLYYNLYQVLNLDRFVLGGGLTAFGEPLFNQIRAAFRRFAGTEAPAVSFFPAVLGEKAGLIGAHLLLAEKK